MNNRKGFRNSVVFKSLSLIIIITTIVLTASAVFNYFFVSTYEKEILTQYEDLFDLYADNCDTLLNNLNSELINLSSTDIGDTSYVDFCRKESEVSYRIAKSSLFNKISNMSVDSDKRAMLFIYVPERGDWIRSTYSTAGEFQRREILDQDIRKYVEAQEIQSNSYQWNILESDGEIYIINSFRNLNGYAGAVIRCDTLAGNLLREDQDVPVWIEIIDNKGNVFSITQDDMEKGSYYKEFEPDVELINAKIRIRLQENAAASKKLFITISILTSLAGVLLLAFNVYYQRENVLRPLLRLKDAMLQLSAGDFSVRLAKKDARSDELGLLYSTFNDMVGQIRDLKISVYESEIENQRIQTNYLKIQTQPHFYVNILNLIYGLAQIKDYPGIQKLVMKTGSYFRYLMGNKGTLVQLREELLCVENYFEIQKIRYNDILSYHLEINDGIEDEMIPPMILQTFTENSIKHNISLVPELVVFVSAEATGNMLRFTISDNGTGIPESVIENLENRQISETGEHIGIANVCARLRLLYGTPNIENGVWISIENPETGGSVVQIQLPKIGVSST